MKRSRSGDTSDDSDDDRRKKKEKSRKRTIKDEPSEYWALMLLRGPHAQFQLDTDVQQSNRPLVNLYRLICHKMHEKCVELLNYDLPKSFPRKRSLSSRELKEMVTAMCEKVLEVDVGGIRVDFFSPAMMDGFEEIFYDGKTTLANYQEMGLAPLAKLCNKLEIKASEEQLNSVQKSLLRRIHKMTIDFVFFVSKPVSSPSSSKIRKLKKSIEILPHRLYQKYVDERETRRLVDRIEFYHFDPEDKPGNNLWTTLPFEEEAHLLEHVLEFGLIQLLPEDVVWSLTEWLIGVRGKMRERIEKDARLANAFNVKRDLSKIEELVAQHVDHALNSKKYPVFNGKWERYVKRMIRTGRDDDDDDDYEACGEFFKVSEHLHKTAYYNLSDRFTKSSAEDSMLYHTVAQLLRFVACFTLHTYHRIHGGAQVGNVDFRQLRKYENAPIVILPTANETATLSTWAVSQLKEIRKVAQPPLPLPPTPTSHKSGPEIEIVLSPNSEKSHRIDDDVTIPEKWKEAFRVAVEWNEELKGQLARVEARYQETKC